jgi:hypothetical protein
MKIDEELKMYEKKLLKIFQSLSFKEETKSSFLKRYINFIDLRNINVRKT